MAATVVKLESLRNQMLLWQIGGYQTIESYQLSELLGYKQWSSLRKQTLTDWKNWMVEGIDYIMVHDEKEMRWYEKAGFALLSRPLVHVSPSRGYLFFTGVGVGKVLERTTKVAAPAFRADTQEVVWEIGSVRVAPKPAPLSSEDRKYQYEVLQTLLSQLKEFSDPAMREVAIAAAEAATGKDFSNLRQTQVRSAPESVATVVQAPKPVPTVVPKVRSFYETVAPLFEDEGFYSLKAIGEKAGGYSSNTAGKAANLVAGRMGYTADQIRRTQLSFNQLPVLRDTNGNPRQMFRFGKEFSNGVVKELRTNTKFRPTPAVPFSSFSEGAGQHVSLTAPLNLGEDEDDAEEEISDNMASILHTLKPSAKH